MPVNYCISSYVSVVAPGFPHVLNALKLKIGTIGVETYPKKHINRQRVGNENFSVFGKGFGQKTPKKRFFASPAQETSVGAPLSS